MDQRHPARASVQERLTKLDPPKPEMLEHDLYSNLYGLEANSPLVTKNNLSIAQLKHSDDQIKDQLENINLVSKKLLVPSIAILTQSGNCLQHIVGDLLTLQKPPIVPTLVMECQKDARGSLTSHTAQVLQELGVASVHLSARLSALVKTLQHTEDSLGKTHQEACLRLWRLTQIERQLSLETAEAKNSKRNSCEHLESKLLKTPQPSHSEKESHPLSQLSQVFKPNAEAKLVKLAQAQHEKTEAYAHLSETYQGHSSLVQTEIIQTGQRFDQLAKDAFQGHLDSMKDLAQGFQEFSETLAQAVQEFSEVTAKLDGC